MGADGIYCHPNTNIRDWAKSQNIRAYLNPALKDRATSASYPALYVSLHICKAVLKAKRPTLPSVSRRLIITPANPVTIGDYLRKTRIERNLSQNEVAEILNEQPFSIYAWEKNTSTPKPKSAAKIIAFMGYIPGHWKSASMEEQLHYARMIKGISFQELAESFGTRRDTINRILGGEDIPRRNILGKIQEFIDEQFALY